MLSLGKACVMIYPFFVFMPAAAANGVAALRAECSLVAIKIKNYFFTGEKK
ncbi:hypothetical protein [Sulfurovum sp.]|uniref:hypothetical protein n=1 Tax=Sulfurovum sp. TaxID=1969726 RepID=UPI0025CF4F19|nr:hypothetical protein [Sulfurovum sp.]